MDSDSAYRPNIWDKEKNYREFESIHGFDIRTHQSAQEVDKHLTALMPGGKLVPLTIQAVSTKHQPVDFTRTRVRDTRDARDPQGIGDALFSRPADTTITEWADALEKEK